MLMVFSMLMIFLVKCIILIIQFLHSSLLHARNTKSKYKLPPGPSLLAIVRSIGELRKKPQQTLANLAKVHGPMIMHLKLGQLTTIVISSPEFAKEILQTNDVLFSDRKIPQAATVQNHYQFSLAFLPISPIWTELRRICNNTLFSNKILDASQELRLKMVQELISDVHTCSLNGEAIDIGRLSFKMILNLLSNTFFSMDLVQSIGEIDEYKDMVGNLARAIATPNLGDVFPFLTIFDLHGIRWSSRTYIPMLFNIFNDHIDKRLKLREEENYVTKSSNKDVLEALLNISQENGQKMDTEKIKHLFLDLIVAGIDTSSYVVERAMTELLHNPNIMSKAKMELEQTIGMGNPLQESQIENLPYLEAIIKETLRKYPPAPFLLPRKAKENVEIHGYIIPKGAQVIINEWAIGRNPNIWDDPNLFSPERFLGSNIDYVKGHHCNFTPFGGGRRICPGMKLATRMLHLMLGSMVNSFNWRLENDMKPEDMDLDQQLQAIAVRIN